MITINSVRLFPSENMQTAEKQNKINTSLLFNMHPSNNIKYTRNQVPETWERIQKQSKVHR